MIKLIAMDMDGTITQHKSKLSDENRQVLLRLGKRYNLAIVGAGTCGRIYRQLLLDRIDIIGSYGMQEGKVGDGVLRIKRSTMVPVDRESVERRVWEVRRAYGYTEFDGDPVEFHETGMITIPLLGTQAKLEAKLKFDPDREKRRTIYKEVSEIFPDYTVFIGGTSSFDMAPKPYDKLYGLEEYARSVHVDRSEIVYAGDDYGPGGNDEQIYKSDIAFVKVDSYLSFPSVMEKFLREAGER